MKKIYSILLVALAVFTSCQKWVEEEPIAKVATVDPTITTSAVSDSSFTATISGVDGVTYYAYAVLQGDKILVNETKLFQKGLGSELAEGVVNYAANPSTTIVLTDLVPNTKYTVYAIAGNSQSITGNVVSATVLTSDNLVPEIDDFTAVDNAFVIEYNEPVERGEGAITAYIMAKNVSWTEPVDSFEIPEDSIAVEDNLMAINVPDAPAGSFVLLAFAEGAVKNMVGTPSEAFFPFGEGVYEYYEFTEEDFEEKEYAADVYSHISNDSWKFSWVDDNEAGDTLIYIMPEAWETTIPVFKAERQLAAYGDVWDENEYPVRVNYVEGGKVSSIPVDANVVAADQIAFALPEPVALLGVISMSIAADTFQDMYGNPNAAYEREDAYMCLLNSTGIEGVYQFSYTDAWGDAWSGEATFIENEDGSYSIYGMSPYFAENGIMGPVVATVNEDGDLEIASEQMYFAAQGVKFYAYEGEYVTISLLDNGCLLMEDAWGLAADPEEGWWDLNAGGYLFVKTSNEIPEAAPAAASVKSLTRQPRMVK